MHEWYPSECAPVTAPVEILSGHFITRDGARIRIPSGSVVSNGWGATGTTIITDQVRNPLPESLRIRWFSYTENKFYQGDFQLDAAGLDRLFDAGYKSSLDGSRNSFDRIVVGMSPGGGVALWLKGELITRELEFFQAAEVQENWNTFTNGSPRSRSEYVEAQLDQLFEPIQLAEALESAAAGLARWDEAFRRKFNWTPRFISRGRIRQLVLRYWNGEVLLDDNTATLREHPSPEQVDAYWANPDGLNYGATVRFDFDELSAAFQRLAPGGPLRLELEADTLAAELAVFIANATEVYRFRKAAVRVFPQ